MVNFERSKTVNYLLAYDYFIFGKDPSNQDEYILITKKGLNAVNSEYFLHEAEKET
jgi:hypothetical protein